jgi:aldehyde dehydrogenase (NAD+)
VKANRVPYGLSSAIYTRDVRSAFVAARDIQAGVTSVNTGTGASEPHLPFGGWKLTGNGRRECGPMALETFTEWKSVYVDYSSEPAGGPELAAG